MVSFVGDKAKYESLKGRFRKMVCSEATELEVGRLAKVREKGHDALA